jgi:hypothetical protein
MLCQDKALVYFAWDKLAKCLLFGGFEALKGCSCKMRDVSGYTLAYFPEHKQQRDKIS